MRDVIDDV